MAPVNGVAESYQFSSSLLAVHLASFVGVSFTVVLLILICACCGSSDKTKRSKKSKKSKKAASIKGKIEGDAEPASKKGPGIEGGSKRGASILTTSGNQDSVLKMSKSGRSASSVQDQAGSKKTAAEVLEFASESDPRYKSLAELEGSGK